MKRHFLFFLAFLFAIVQGAWAQDVFITDVMLIGHDETNVNTLKTQYANEGWTVIDYDLNKGAGGECIYLLYKTNNSTGSSGTPITDLYLHVGNERHATFDRIGRTYNLASHAGSEHFLGNKGDLNSAVTGTADMNLYYYKGGNSLVRVTSISFDSSSTDAVGEDDTATPCDLNKGTNGDKIYMHVGKAIDSPALVYNEEQLYDALTVNNANIKLMADIALTQRVYIPASKTVTLDLNGHTLQRNEEGYHWYHMVIHNYGTLTVNDGSGDNSGKITGGRAYGGAGIYCEGGSSLTFNGGSVIGNSSTNDPSNGAGFGGGILINEGAEATITGGVIKSNSSPQGGGIYNQGTLTISSNALISNNTGYDGGGIFNMGTLNITGGTIKNNQASTLGGGGITNYGTINMTGGSIMLNASTTAGGGIWNGNYLNMQGNPVVSCNTSGTNGNDNVFLNGSTAITVTGAFTEGAEVGVRPASTSNVITSGYSTYNAGTTSDNFFFPDIEFYSIYLYNDEAKLKGPEGNWIDYKSTEIAHTDGNTWYIESEADLAHIAYHVQAGNSSYQGITFVLNTDLDMSAHFWTPIGTGHPFKGNFDGNGHTISGIYVNRPTNSYNGLFGYVKGSITLTSNKPGCDFIKNIVLINSNIKGGDHTGGVVGHIENCMTLENVVCQADVTGEFNVGGIVGNVYGVEGPVYIKNCLFLSGNITGTGTHAAVIGNIVDKWVSHSNNYYADPASYDGNDYDVRAYPIIESLPEGVTLSYSSGVYYNSKLYHPGGTVNFTMKYDINQFVSVEVNGNELVGSEGNYSFNFNPNAGSYVISVTAGTYSVNGSGTEAEPYRIASQEDWNHFVSYLNSGSAPNDFSGVYFKLDADEITINQMMGTASHPFCGIFDGDGKTLTLAFGDSEDYLNQKCAPFYRINNATIKKLVVSGNIYSSTQHNGGIAVRAVGNNNLIQNCVSSVSIHSNRSGDCTNGGFIGILDSNGGQVSFNGCAFTGKLVGESATNWGGFVGWRYYENNRYNTVSFTDCLFVPASVSIATPDGSSSRPFCRSYNTDGASYSNCYYTEALQGADGGTAVFAYNSKPDGIGDEGSTYNVSGITVYAHGIKYGTEYYMAAPTTLDLTANAHDGNYWTTFYCGHTGYKIDDTENACAYTATVTEEGTEETEGEITLHNLGKVIPAGTAVIIVGEDNRISMTASTDAATVSANDLHGVDVETLTQTVVGRYQGCNTLYFMSKNDSDDFGFFGYNGTIVPARKAFLAMYDVPNSNEANLRQLTMKFEEGTTEIEEVDSGEWTVGIDDSWYTINGVKLDGKPHVPGIYIYHGKKVAIQ